MRRTVPFVAIALLALMTTGCSEENPVSGTPKAAAQHPAPASAPDLSKTGVIDIRVTYAGAPVVKTLSINKDVAVCGKETKVESIEVGGDHGLDDAVVSVTDVAAPPSTGAPKIDQRGCQFRPHVLAMAPGELEIVNSDGVLHNIHTYSKLNEPINKAQPKFKKVMTATLSKPEMVKVTCDVHSWMSGWIAVVAHPFGVTDDQGETRIAGVPSGSHTLEVWHPQLGRLSQPVTVKAGETTKVVFAYPAKAA